MSLTPVVCLSVKNLPHFSFGSLLLPTILRVPADLSLTLLLDPLSQLVVLQTLNRSAALFPLSPRFFLYLTDVREGGDVSWLPLVTFPALTPSSSGEAVVDDDLRVREEERFTHYLTPTDGTCVSLCLSFLSHSLIITSSGAQV